MQRQVVRDLVERGGLARPEDPGNEGMTGAGKIEEQGLLVVLARKVGASGGDVS